MSKKKVLIVEDERIVAVDIRRTLLSCGYSICGIVANAKDAIEQSILLEPDLILMDIMLQNNDDGIETAEKIIEKRNVPLIFLTAFADDETLDRAKQINPFGYIIKPFEERELQAAMAMAFYRQEMEQALIESERKYRSLVETIGEGIITLDEDNVILFANSTAAQIFGFQHEKDLINYSLFDFISGKNREIARNEYQKSKKGINAKFELEINGKDNKTRILRVTSTPKFYNSIFKGSFNVLSDFTEQKQIENALEKKTKQQKKLLESAKHLTSTLELNKVLEQIGTLAKDFLNAYSCSIYLVDEKKHLLQPVVVIDPQYKGQLLNHPLDVRQSYTGQAVIHQKAFLFNDAGSSGEGQFIPGTKEEKDEKLLVAPLLIENEVLGVMSLTRRGLSFTENELQLVQAYASFASSALKNAQVHRTLKKEMEFRKNAQEKLRDTQFLLATIFKNVPNIVVYEKSKYKRFYSENIYDLIGISAKDLIENTNKFASLIHPSDNQILQKKLQHWNEQGNSGMLTTWFRLHTTNGDYIWIEDRMVKINKAEGESYIAGVMIDNTNLKEVEEALRKSESRYKAVVEDQTELISRYLPDRTLTFVNDAYCRFFGKKRNELIGIDWTSLLPDETAEFAKQMIQQLSPKQPSVTFEYKMISKLETNRWLETKERAIFEGQNVCEIQSVSRDITDRKLAEIEREKMQLQLMQTQKMETIGRLAGGIAHDFNNLVMAITSYTEKIRKKIPQDSPFTDDLEVIFSCGNKAAQLTQQLLGFSRKQIVKPKFLNINATILELKVMLERLIKEEVTLELELQTGLQNVLIDPLQLEQILINLIMNANDAIETSGTISITTKNETIVKRIVSYIHTIKVGEYVRISVKDTGSGISPDNMKHVFEPFFTTKEQGKGTGLGLANVYGICKQNMGYINVSSRLKKGTEFVLYFPMAKTIEKKEIILPEIVDLSVGVGKDVLLVEDDDNIREFIVEILDDFGYQVEEAANGELAAGIMEGGAHFDLLITDVNMPNVSGKAVAKLFFRKFPLAKVLYISGYTEDEEIRNSIKQASVHFLHKPFSSRQLIDKIKSILENYEKA